MNTQDCLNETKWTTPESYGGYNPIGEYVIYARNRDSDCLSNSNYERILQDLTALAKKHDAEDVEPTAYDWRASHWAVGWVEYIMVKPTAPQSVLDAAAEIICALSDYPVYDEDDFCEREYNEANDNWSHLPLSERVDLCKEAGVSIFAARQDYIPEGDDQGYIQQHCLGY